MNFKDEVQERMRREELKIVAPVLPMVRVSVRVDLVSLGLA
jgi:hypothetical protein